MYIRADSMAMNNRKGAVIEIWLTYTLLTYHGYLGDDCPPAGTTSLEYV
jgi:hypothetical protein